MRGAHALPLVGLEARDETVEQQMRVPSHPRLFLVRGGGEDYSVERSRYIAVDCWLRVAARSDTEARPNEIAQRPAVRSRHEVGGLFFESSAPGGSEQSADF